MESNKVKGLIFPVGGGSGLFSPTGTDHIETSVRQSKANMTNSVPRPPMWISM